MMDPHRSNGSRFRCSVTGILALALASPVAAQSEYDIDSERPVSLRALIDTRIVIPGKAPSWMDRGPAKTRYGGQRSSGDFDRVVRLCRSEDADPRSSAEQPESLRGSDGK